MRVKRVPQEDETLYVEVDTDEEFWDAVATLEDLHPGHIIPHNPIGRVAHTPDYSYYVPNPPQGHWGLGPEVGIDIPLSLEPGRAYYGELQMQVAQSFVDTEGEHYNPHEESAMLSAWINDKLSANPVTTFIGSYAKIKDFLPGNIPAQIIYQSRFTFYAITADLTFHARFKPFTTYTPWTEEYPVRAMKVRWSYLFTPIAISAIEYFGTEVIAKAFPLLDLIYTPPTLSLIHI